MPASLSIAVFLYSHPTKRKHYLQTPPLLGGLMRLSERPDQHHGNASDHHQIIVD
jgi:hypothetical protein